MPFPAALPTSRPAAPPFRRGAARVVVPLLAACLLLPLPAAVASPAAMHGPAGGKRHLPMQAELETSSVKLVFLASLRLFQQWISPIDGPRCSFSPSCSAFGHQAIHQHGPVRGVLLTADRLLRCTPLTTAGTDYLLLPNGRLFDPVSANLLHEQ